MWNIKNKVNKTIRYEDLYELKCEDIYQVESFDELSYDYPNGEFEVKYIVVDYSLYQRKS